MFQKTIGFITLPLLCLVTLACTRPPTAPVYRAPAPVSFIPVSKPTGLSARDLPVSARSIAARARVIGGLRQEAAALGLKVGSPLFIRSFKQEKRMEVWMQPEHGGRFKRFKTYGVCSYPGPMGPKLRDGDLMIPEGFYSIGARSLNPDSEFHLAFDLGFPNRLERSLGRTGSALMVHGGCESIGCYAIGDDNIEELYTLVYEALKGGQTAVGFHAYPFVLSEQNLAKYKGHAWYAFWRNLKQGYDAFEHSAIPPRVLYGARTYHIAGTG